MAADILVLGMSIWLGEKSSIATQIVERLYGNSHLLNDAGQYAYYGRVGGCLVTGNEDGVKHCAMNVLYSLQHLGYTIPPQADAGWIGEAGPGPVVSGRGLGRALERLHEPQHHLRDLEHAARGADAEGRRRHPRAWQPALRVGRRLPVRFPEPRASRLEVRLAYVNYVVVALLGAGVQLLEAPRAPHTGKGTRHAAALVGRGDDRAGGNRSVHSGGRLV